MDTEALCSELVKRAENFRWNIDRFKSQVSGNERYLVNFNILKDYIIKYSTSPLMQVQSKGDKLRKISYKIYLTYKVSSDDLMKFGPKSPYTKDVYAVYFFHLLSTYLHENKRIDGKTLREFVKGHHPMGFNDPDSPNYQSTESFSEEEKLRKFRNRHLSKGAVYHKNSQWSAMTKDSEHEWSFYYRIENEKKSVWETSKRFYNLYNDIEKSIGLMKEDGDKEHLREGYKKFLSKLQKFTYKNYIELIEAMLSHINDDKEYYGLNLYRLERKMQPYKIISEVNTLLACPPDLEDFALWGTVVLADINFPKLYQDFAFLPYNKTEIYAEQFPGFLQDIVISGCLIFDELVENGVFGDDWENLFRTVMNELAKDVLYDPSQLDFSIKEGSQEKFEKLLAAPVFVALCREAGINFKHFDVHELPF